MTKRIFERFARFAAMHNLDNEVLQDLCQLFQDENARFDKERFLLKVQSWKNTKYKKVA